MNKCEDGSCNVNADCAKGSCDSGNSCQSGCNTGCSMCNKFVAMADKAWEHAVMEKMKVHWEKTMGEKMDAIAEAAVATSAAYHMNMIKGKTDVMEAAKKIQEAMTN